MNAASNTLPESSRLNTFAQFLLERRLTGTDFSNDYTALQRWSVDQPALFGPAAWDFFAVVGELDDVAQGQVSSGLPAARLNYTENLLRWRDDQASIVFWGEDKIKERLSRAELYRRVAHLSEALRELGVVAGDHVAGCMPSTADAVVAFLASASLGAVFAPVSPDVDQRGLLERFSLIEPKILFFTDGHYLEGKTIDLMHKLGGLVAGLPTLKHTIVVREVHREHDLSKIANAIMLDDLVAPYRYVDEIDFVRLAFDHPLCVMFPTDSHGVVGKAVEATGETLLRHLTEHQLGSDVRPADRIFHFVSRGDTTWTWLVSALASGATLLLYDGAPLALGGTLVFDYAVAEHMTHLAASAGFIDAIAALGMTPIRTHDLTSLRTLIVHEASLPATLMDYLGDNVKPGIQVTRLPDATLKG